MEATTLKPIKFTIHTNLIGLLSAKEQITFIAKVDGTLSAIYAQIGSKVKAHQIIAEIENKNLKDHLQLLIQAHEIKLDQYNRANNLHNKGHISKLILEERAQELNNTRQNLSKAKNNYNNTIITAPFNGIISSFHARKQSYVKNGDKIATLYNPDSLVVDVLVPYTVLSTIKIGTLAKILDQEHKITNIPKTIDCETKMANIEIEVDQIKDRIIGSEVEVIIETYHNDQAIVIPKTAVFMNSNNTYVRTIKSGKIESVKIDLGRVYNGLYEVLSGLSAGDIIATYSDLDLDDGEAVELSR